MKDVLQYIFSSFWVFFGSVGLLVCIFDGLVKVIQAIRGHKV